MWDRFRGAVPQKLGRSQQHQRPPQEQQYQQYRSGGNVYEGGAARGNGGYSYTVQGGPPPPRPPREFIDQQAHYYPDEQQAAYHEPPYGGAGHEVASTHLDPPTQRRDSRFRPASSIYSPQPSPLQTNFGPSAPNKRYTFSNSEDISPPSSPEPFTPTANGIPHPVPDISPIDEDDEQYEQMSQQLGAAGVRSGGIPSLRRERRQKQDAALRESRSREQMRSLQPSQPRSVSGSRRGYHGGEVRWDPATGELTSSDKGRPSQVKPAEYAKGFGHSPESDRQGEGAGGGPVSSSTSFGQRVRRIAPPGFATGGAEKHVTGHGNPSSRRLSPSPSPSPRQSPRNATSTDPAAGAFMSDRPAWKGASGRTALVDPVHDKPDVAPLNLPRKRAPKSPTSPDTAAPTRMDTTLASPPVSPLGPETQPPSLGETIREVIPSSQREAAQHSSGGNAATAVSDYPSPPSAGAEPSDTQGPPETVNAQPNAPLTQSPSTLTPSTAIRRKPAPSSQSHQQQDSVNSASSQGDPYNYKNYTANPTSGANPAAHALGVPDGWTQPPSRFSISTYAASSHATPRPSTDGFDDYDGYEEPPSNQRSATDPTSSDSAKQESVMDRRRPKLGDVGAGGSAATDQEPIVISLKDAQWMAGGGVHRKPLGPGAGNAASRDNGGDKTPTGPPKHRPESIASMAGSIYKSLPPAPPESSAVDRVDALNARLRALANRRINITRSVKQMTELMPTDNIMASAEVLLKRETERKKVEALRLELAEVQREEYELGIKLHRAYKRIDREAHYEPTTLWVRRVTG